MQALPPRDEQFCLYLQVPGVRGDVQRNRRLVGLADVSDTAAPEEASAGTGGEEVSVFLHRPPIQCRHVLLRRFVLGLYVLPDWGPFGHLQIGRARRALMAFVMHPSRCMPPGVFR